MIDERALGSLRERLALVPTFLKHATSDRVQAAAAKAGVGTTRGPNLLEGAEPSLAAQQLSVRLAVGAQAALRRVAPFAEVQFLGNALPMVHDGADEIDSPGLGLPLVFACVPDLGATVGEMLLSAHFANRMVQAQRIVHERMNHVVRIEHCLWTMAGEPRIPYGIAFRTVEWALRPGGPKRGDATICLRCGAFYACGRATADSERIRCAQCSKEPARARLWPTHAVMPHDRGCWWLRCGAEGCSNAFVGPRHARRCPACRRASVTPSARRPLRDR